MLIPKDKNFNLPDNNQNDYLYKIYNNKYSEIINNNDDEIKFLIKESTLICEDVVDQNSEQFSSALKSYDSCSSYVIDNFEKDTPYIKLFCINDIDSIYYGCYLITVVN